MSDGLNRAINYQTVTKFVQTGANGVPNAFAALGADNPMNMTTPVDGKSVTWDIFNNSRVAARAVAYGAPSASREQSAIATRSAQLIHSYVSTLIPLSDLTSIRKAGENTIDQKGMNHIARTAATRGMECQTLRLQAMYSLLRYGKVYMRNVPNGNGNGYEILPSSSGATITIDFGVPSGNIVETPSWNWHTGTPDVAGNLTNLSNANLKLGNPALSLLFYGKNVAGYLRNNDSVLAKLIASNTQRVSDSIANGVIPDVYGFRWLPIDSVFHEASDGTQTNWFDDRIIAVPRFSRDWFEFQEGSYLVPNEGSSEVGRIESMVNGFDTAYGMFSYGRREDDPPKVKLFAGDTFLPTPYVPSNIYSYKVNA